MKKIMMMLMIVVCCVIFISIAINTGSRRHKYVVDPRFAMEKKTYDSVWISAFPKNTSTNSDGLAGR